MIVGTDDGQIHVSIYDSFIIGTFKYSLPQSSERDVSLQLCYHASHPNLSTHILVFRPSKDDSASTIYLIPMDLTFIHSSPENLSLLASKTTTLQKLLRYVKQVQMHMIHEWQSTRELPTRFLNSINETLRESENYGEMTIGQALYHSVVTGHTFPEVKEWLIDQLAERVSTSLYPLDLSKLTHHRDINDGIRLSYQAFRHFVVLFMRIFYRHSSVSV